MYFACEQRKVQREFDNVEVFWAHAHLNLRNLTAAYTPARSL